MDGVKNEKEEEKIFDIKVQSNPIFEKEEIKSYNPHPPCSDDYIEIKVYKQETFAYEEMHFILCLLIPSK